MTVLKTALISSLSCAGLDILQPLIESSDITRSW